MFKKIFRLTFVTFVWKQYKRIIVSTTLLFAFLWFVGFAHSEYLDFATRQEDQSTIGLSFFIKWIALLAGVGIYFLFHYFFSRSARNNKKQSIKTTKITDEADDPFSEIREKKTLRTRAEIVIDNKNDR